MRQIAVVLALIGASLASAEGPARVALLVGKDVSYLRSAAEAATQVPGARIERFDLYKGMNELDRTDRILRSRNFEGVVSLGGSAYEYLQNLKQGDLRKVATLVDATTNQGDVEVLSSQPDATAWADLLLKAVPTGSIGTIAGSDAAASQLGPVKAELESRGRQLVVGRIGSGGNTTKEIQRVIAQSKGFFYPRDPALLKGKVALAILKGSISAGIPVIAFSRKLVKAGALVALEADPASAGRRAIQHVTGANLEALALSRTVNRRLAEQLNLPDL